MIKKYNNISLACGAPGMLLQYVGIGIGQPFCLIVGTVLFMVGLAYYAKAKGRNAAWCLMCFFQSLD